MAREKKPVHKVQITDGKRSIIQQLLREYDIQSAEDIQVPQARKSPFVPQVAKRPRRIYPISKCPSLYNKIFRY